MNSIVTLNDTNCPITTSLAIAEGVGNPHASVIKVIRQNASDLEEFGPLGFEIQKGKPLPQGGFAKSTEFAMLNEQQSALLLTYFRNNDTVKAFKKALIKAFFEMRDELNKRQAPAENFPTRRRAARPCATRRCRNARARAAAASRGSRRRPRRGCA